MAAGHFDPPLEKDYCGDLLADTSDALRWLESTNQTLTTGTVKLKILFINKSLIQNIAIVMSKLS